MGSAAAAADFVMGALIARTLTLTLTLTLTAEVAIGGLITAGLPHMACMASMACMQVA